MCSKNKFERARDLSANHCELRKSVRVRAKTAEVKKGALVRKPPKARGRKIRKKIRRPNTDYDFFLLAGASSRQSLGEFLEHHAPWSANVLCGMHLGHSFAAKAYCDPVRRWQVVDHATLHSWFGAARHQGNTRFKTSRGRSTRAGVSRSSRAATTAWRNSGPAPRLAPE